MRIITLQHIIRAWNLKTKKNELNGRRRSACIRFHKSCIRFYCLEEIPHSLYSILDFFYSVLVLMLNEESVVFGSSISCIRFQSLVPHVIRVYLVCRCALFGSHSCIHSPPSHSTRLTLTMCCTVIPL